MLRSVIAGTAVCGISCCFAIIFPTGTRLGSLLLAAYLGNQVPIEPMTVTVLDAIRQRIRHHRREKVLIPEILP